MLPFYARRQIRVLPAGLQNRASRFVAGDLNIIAHASTRASNSSRREIEVIASGLQRACEEINNRYLLIPSIHRNSP